MEPEEADYRELDGPSFCQEINQAAYDLVLESLEGTRGSSQLLYEILISKDFFSFGEVQ